MKKWLIVAFFFLLNKSFGQTINNINISGNNISKKETILFFFYEYTYQNRRNFSEEALINSLKSFKRRLERTGWYRNIKVEFITNSNDITLVDINVSFTEKIPYTLYLKNNYLGIGKYNIWGEGKEIAFEIGLNHKSIKITDRMFNFSTYFYECYLGSESFLFSQFVNDSYEETQLLKQRGYFRLGNNIFPDNQLFLQANLLWIQDTNQVTLKNLNYFTLSWVFDITEGYPVILNGLKLGSYFNFYTDLLFSLEDEINAYLNIFPGVVIAIRLHSIFSYPELPPYQKYSLRSMNGLRTLSSFSGMIGDNVWDGHLEVRWAFWDVIPFLLYDLQLEAFAFAEMGEAREKITDFGSPHIVYGGGIRIYLDTFAIRTEIGVDKTSKVSVLSSFELPF
ncbi:MAG: POTRA domain-containing protein [Brevinematia bacterium]